MVSMAVIAVLVARKIRETGINNGSHNRYGCWQRSGRIIEAKLD